MMSFAHIESDLFTTLHFSARQPVDYELRPFDLADFVQRDRKLVLPGIGGEN